MSNVKNGVARLHAKNQLDAIRLAWKTAWLSKLFRLKLLLTPVVFLLYSMITRPLAGYVEGRKGILLSDNLLYLFPSFDCSLYIFLLLYSSMLLFLLLYINRPEMLIRVLGMHLAVAIVRQVCILLIALEPPVGIIALRDVFLENTVYPHKPLTKDLFFSGHAASIWIYFLYARSLYFKIWLFFATLLMSFMLLSMRVHYTYDIYGALFITALIYSASAKLRYHFEMVKEQLL